MISIAIDGPSGSGKSSISKCLAKKLNFVNVDTGALYRSVAYYFLKNDINYDCENTVLENLKNINIKVKYKNNNQFVFLNNKNITNDIRSDKVSMISSRISSMPCIRNYLLSLQRDIALKNNIIMDGRDIGTVVLPNADVKIFLTASPKSRAQRRYEQLSKNYPEIKFSEVLKNINKRDFDDVHRKISPLKPAEDAIIFDSSNYTFEESVNYILNLIEERVNFEAK